MNRTALALSISLGLLAACRRADTSMPEASRAVATSDRSALAQDATLGREASSRERFGATHAARWPGAAGFDDVTAMVRRDARGSGSLTWVREGDSSLVDERSFPLGDAAVEGIASIDLGGDPGEELVVFGARFEPFASSVAVFSLPSQRAQPIDDGARGAALDGARSLDEVRARLPLERPRTEAEQRALTLTALLGQLCFAPVDALRSMIDARGLALCVVRAPQDRPRRERCRTLSGRALSDAAIERELRTSLRSMFDAMTTLNFSCSTSPEQQCTASRSGGTEITATIVGDGATRRIAKVTHVDHEIGE
jgi:hypothetical protein